MGTACKDILGDTNYMSKETIQRKAIPVMRTLKGSSQIARIVADELTRHGIKRYGEISLNKENAELLEEFFNSAVPKIRNTYKNIKNL